MSVHRESKKMWCTFPDVVHDLQHLAKHNNDKGGGKGGPGGKDGGDSDMPNLTVQTQSAGLCRGLYGSTALFGTIIGFSVGHLAEKKV